MTVGENIRKYRIQRGLTQKQLGKLCGMADSAIRRYENNGANPKRETLVKIAKALGVFDHQLDPDMIMGFDTPEEYEAYRKSILDSIVKSGVSHIEQSLKNQYKEDMNQAFDKLNQKGQMEAVKRVEELTEIKKYTEPDQ